MPRSYKSRRAFSSFLRAASAFSPEAAALDLAALAVVLLAALAEAGGVLPFNARAVETFLEELPGFFLALLVFFLVCLAGAFAFFIARPEFLRFGGDIICFVSNKLNALDER